MKFAKQFRSPLGIEPGTSVSIGQHSTHMPPPLPHFKLMALVPLLLDAGGIVEDDAGLGGLVQHPATLVRRKERGEVVLLQGPQNVGL